MLFVIVLYCVHGDYLCALSLSVYTDNEGTMLSVHVVCDGLLADHPY